MMALVKVVKSGAKRASKPKASMGRKAGLYAIEIYSEERMREFAEADRLTAAERRKLKPRQQ